MNPNPADTANNSMPAWFEPFSEPRTIPAGWDLSEYFPVVLSDPSWQNDLIADTQLSNLNG
jgi:hypothetical protein